MPSECWNLNLKNPNFEDLVRLEIRTKWNETKPEEVFLTMSINPAIPVGICLISCALTPGLTFSKYLSMFCSSSGNFKMDLVPFQFRELQNRSCSVPSKNGTANRLLSTKILYAALCCVQLLLLNRTLVFKSPAASHDSLRCNCFGTSSYIPLNLPL